MIAIKEIGGITDDTRLCGSSMYFCSAHLRCEILPEGIDKDQLPNDVSCENIEKLINNDDFPEWDRFNQKWVKRIK